jgi:hypothetical protein
MWWRMRIHKASGSYLTRICVFKIYNGCCNLVIYGVINVKLSTLKLRFLMFYYGAPRRSIVGYEQFGTM